MEKIKTITTQDNHSITVGYKFTISGFGKSARGHQVINGKSAKTKRKMNVHKHDVFVVRKIISDSLVNLQKVTQE